MQSGIWQQVSDIVITTLFTSRIGHNLWPFYHPGIYPGHSAWHPFEGGTMATGNGFGHCWGRNGKLCIL